MMATSSRDCSNYSN